jgi:hypothetical protein
MHHVRLSLLVLVHSLPATYLAMQRSGWIIRPNSSAASH